MFYLQRLAHILLPNLPIQLEEARRGHFGLYIIPDVLGHDCVYAASGALHEVGIQVGMPLYRAKQAAPGALVIENDETTYHTVHNGVHTQLKTFSPAIETVEIGQFLINVRGLTRLFGNEQALARKILEAIQRNYPGLEIQVGIANGKFAAEQAAWSAPRNGICVVPDGAEAAFLAPLPLTTLPYLRAEIRKRLRLLGIQSLGEFAELSQSAVAVQFGPEATTLHTLACGRDRRLFQPDTPPLRILRSKTLKEPISDFQILLNLLHEFSQRLAGSLKLRGYHTEALRLTVQTEQQPIQVVDLPLAKSQAINPPTADGGLLSRIAQALLGQLTISAPVTAFSLCAYPLHSWSLEAYQQGLVGVGVSERENRLEQTLEQLMNRFGKDAVRIASVIGQPLPRPTKVMVNALNLPELLTLAGEQEPIFGIDEHWRVERHWWRIPIRRDYYRIILADGSLRNLFQDLTNGEWFIDRAWPIR